MGSPGDAAAIVCWLDGGFVICKHRPFIEILCRYQVRTLYMSKKIDFGHGWKL